MKELFEYLLLEVADLKAFFSKHPVLLEGVHVFDRFHSIIEL